MYDPPKVDKLPGQFQVLQVEQVSGGDLLIQIVLVPAQLP